MQYNYFLCFMKGEEMPDRSDQKEDINVDARERWQLPPDVILHRPAQEAEPEKKKRVSLF